VHISAVLYYWKLIDLHYSLQRNLLYLRNSVVSTGMAHTQLESALRSPFRILYIFYSNTLSVIQVAESCTMRVSMTNNLARACKSLWVQSRGYAAVTDEKYEKYQSVQSESGQEFENRTTWINKAIAAYWNGKWNILMATTLNIQVKVKSVPLQAWIGPKGGLRYSSTLSWPRHLEGSVWSASRSGRFTPG
jgi:hypothetical protein